MRSLKAVLAFGSVAAILTMASFSSVGYAQAGQAGSPSAIQNGRDTFQKTCAACHGEKANGKGPAASSLKPRPVDLTMITKKGNGSFPAAAVEAAIRGTGPARAHGTPGMLVWGAMFLADANGNDAEADVRISDLVAYIRSVQK